MKKTAYIFCILSLCASSCFASDQQREEFEHKGGKFTPSPQEFKGNWTETFILINGESIIHTPTHTALGYITAGTGIVLKSLSYNGMPISIHGLNVKTNSTREEFVQALLKSGLYENKKY